jgi:hypothetical protein
LLTTAETRPVSGSIHVDWGDYVAKGTRTNLGGQLTWRPSPLVNFTADYSQEPPFAWADVYRADRPVHPHLSLDPEPHLESDATIRQCL